MPHRASALFLLVSASALVLVVPPQAFGQVRDSVRGVRRVDTTSPVTFAESDRLFPSSQKDQRVDLTLTGGAGYYSQGITSALQPTANADFFAQTSDLDFTAGFHWGFSNPATGALDLGVRFPITVAQLSDHGVYADAALLFIDDGADTAAFSTGFRMAIAARAAPLEVRFAAELRRFPFGGDRFEAWAGLEVGFFFSLLHEKRVPPTPKDSLRAELRYIATTSELDALDAASTPAAIQAWLARFWQARNVTGSKMNEARLEYMRRVREANKRFSAPRQMGVTTDEGRVLLLYGEPDNTDEGVSTINPERRYVLWSYPHRVRGYSVGLFLFVNSDQAEETGTFGGRGEFRQIYSNIAGEPSVGIPSDLPPNLAGYIEGFR